MAAARTAGGNEAILCCSYWGDALEWGSRNLQASAGECCESCRNYKPLNSDQPGCNGASQCAEHRSLTLQPDSSASKSMTPALCVLSLGLLRRQGGLRGPVPGVLAQAPGTCAHHCKPFGSLHAFRLPLLACSLRQVRVCHSYIRKAARPRQGQTCPGPLASLGCRDP